MDNQKQQVLERIKQANNILVTVSANPSVDQLAACVGLTIMLNELGKHATAVFSGAVPSTIEFLQPEKTLEKNTDSLRDFIISLDKAKADKLRYKVEDKVVKIFITPYRTSITDRDLEFSQGDFNVEVVVALGVHDQKDLDQAIIAHGRILHDATVMSINTTAGDNLGTINWQDVAASSLSEMVVNLAANFDPKVLDNQVATALLTGIVAETDRFSNSRTTPETMKASAQLMAAGANQQLVATKLQAPAPVIPAPAPPAPTAAPPSPAPAQAARPKPDDGTLEIAHQEQPTPTVPQQPAAQEAKPLPEPQPQEQNDDGPQIHIDESGQLHQLNEDREFLNGPGPDDGSADTFGSSTTEDELPSGAPAETEKFVFNPPTLGGTLTANSQPEGQEQPTDPLTLPSVAQSAQSGQPILSHDEPLTATKPKQLVIQPPAGTPAADVAASGVSQGQSADVASGTPTILPEPTLSDASLKPAAPAITQLPDAALPAQAAPSGPAPVIPDDHESLADIEKAVDSPHAVGSAPVSPAPDVTSARDAVMNAINEANATSTASDPIAALNAQPLGAPLHESDASAAPASPSAPGALPPIGNPNFSEQAPSADSPSDQPLDMPLPPTLTPPPANLVPPTSSGTDNPSAPPPVPPPMMPFPPTGQ